MLNPARWATDRPASMIRRDVRQVNRCASVGWAASTAAADQQVAAVASIAVSVRVFCMA